MPLYEYQCGACGQRFELIRRFSDPAVDVCTLCGKGPINRLQSSPAIQFKGSGWYITDYAQKGKSGDASSNAKGESGSTSDASSSTTAKTETKGDSGGKSDSTPASTPAKAEGSGKD